MTLMIAKSVLCDTIHSSICPISRHLWQRLELATTYDVSVSIISAPSLLNKTLFSQVRKSNNVQISVSHAAVASHWPVMFPWWHVRWWRTLGINLEAFHGPWSHSRGLKLNHWPQALHVFWIQSCLFKLICGNKLGINTVHEKNWSWITNLHNPA